MKWLALILVLWPLVGLAEGLPALYAVTGVAAGDVLNIRAAPSAQAAVVGGLPPDAAGIEVVGLSPDGKWAEVGSGEAAGFVALRFLVRQPGPDWLALATPLRCSGTEPFWSLQITAKSALYSSPDGVSPLFVTRRWPGASWQPVAGLAVQGGFVALRAGACSDGMSDRRFGIIADLFLTRGGAAVSQTGCCTLQP